MKSKSFIAALLLLFCATSFWASDTSVDGIWYNFNSTDLTASVTYRGSSSIYANDYSGSITIPSSVSYNGETYSVTSVGDNAFYNCTSLTSVTIPNSVTSIGDYAFYACSDLTSVHISDLVAWCGISFSNSHSNPLCYARHLYLNDSEIMDLTIPNSVTSIGNYAFCGCYALTNVTIPNSVTSIGSYAFKGCFGLTNVTIPNSVTSVGGSAFQNCFGLTNLTIPNSVTSIGESAFRNCSSLTSVTIPNNVTSIGNDAFYDCSGLTSVSIGNSVTSIGDNAFYNCSGLTSVSIGNSVTSIGGNAFYNCSGLTSVVLNSSSIASKTYSYSSNISKIFGSQVREYVIGKDVTSLGSYAFYNCSSLTNVTIGNSVTSIGDYAFYGCSGLMSVTIPNSVTSIGKYAFYIRSGLTSVTIGNSVTNIGENAFSNCFYLTRVTLNSNAIVGKTYSSNSNLSNIFGEQVTEYIIGDEVTSIGSYAFYNCSNLTNVTIGNNVTSIGEKAFSGCSGLTNPVYSEHVFAYLPRFFVGAYTIPNGIESIAGEAFRDCSNLTSITIPSSLTNIGKYAFISCANLASIVVETGNSKYDSRNNCNAIIETETNVLIAGCKNTIIPNSVTKIGEAAFYGCTGLTSVTIPNSVTSVGEWAFGWCSGLTSVAIGNSVTSIENLAFSSCSTLPNVTIPNSVTSIGEKAFGPCSNLTSMTMLGETPPTIGGNVFYNSNPPSIYVPCGTLEVYKQSWSSYSSKIKYLPLAYTITGEVNDSNAGNVTVPANICEQLYATPNYGYHFVQWSDGVTDNPRTIELTQDTTLIAEFAVDTSGSCGNDLALTWQYDSDKKALTISGTGDLTANKRYGLEADKEMTTLVIEDGVSIIGDSAFANIPTLTTVKIGKDVRKIQDYAFGNCYNLASIYNYRPTPATIVANTFEEVDKYACTLYVLHGSEDMYRSAVGWSDFYNILPIPASAIEEIISENSFTVSPQKIIDNGQLFITLPDGSKYSATGVKVE